MDQQHYHCFQRLFRFTSHKKCVAGKHRSLHDIVYNNIASIGIEILRHHAIVQSFDYNTRKLLMVILLRLCHCLAFPSAFVDYCSILWTCSCFRIFTAISTSHSLKFNMGCFTTMYSLSVFKIGKHLCKNSSTKACSFHPIKVQGCGVHQARTARSFHTWRPYHYTWTCFAHDLCGKHTRRPSATSKCMNDYRCSRAQEFLLSTCSRSFLQRYKWGINLRTSSLPLAYLLYFYSCGSYSERSFVG